MRCCLRKPKVKLVSTPVGAKVWFFLGGGGMLDAEKESLNTNGGCIFTVKFDLGLWNRIWGKCSLSMCCVSKELKFISNISCIFDERHIYLCILLTVQVIVRIGHHQLFQAKCCFSIAVETNKKNSQLTNTAKDVSYFCLNNYEAQDALCLIHL